MRSSATAYRVLAQGRWADVEYRWDSVTDDWRVMILDTNAYGRFSFVHIAVGNDVIGGGGVPREKLVYQTRAASSKQIRVRAGADQVQIIPIHPVDQQPVRLDVAIAEVAPLAA